MLLRDSAKQVEDASRIIGNISAHGLVGGRHAVGRAQWQWPPGVPVGYLWCR